MDQPHLVHPVNLGSAPEVLPVPVTEPLLQLYDPSGDSATTGPGLNKAGRKFSPKTSWIIAICCSILFVVRVVTLSAVLAINRKNANNANNATVQNVATTVSVSGGGSIHISSIRPSPTSVAKSSQTPSGTLPSTIGTMTGTAAAIKTYSYPSPNAWSNQNYVLYCVSSSRRVGFEDHGGVVSTVQAGVGVTMSEPAPGWPKWEDLTAVGTDNQL
ncbi:hypothetical protein B0J14DRAFT_654193 [Halenospora varia]|nr:hypothetical protein B0J14DRAFT_654193 [Halenospora varia]